MFKYRDLTVANREKDFKNVLKAMLIHDLAA